MPSTVTITFVKTCAAEGHVTVDVSATGTGVRQFTYERADLLQNIDWVDAETIARDIMRLHFRGLTNQQARAELLAGITVTI